MPRCPECGEEISYLFNVCEEVCRYVFELDDDGCPRYEHDDAWEGDWSVYECPNCGAELFHSEEEAEAFLKQKPAKQTTLPVEG
jgi:predicted RNA-binding Zn-ribbon protein involved in translation (DUF1610 family)